MMTRKLNEKIDKKAVAQMPRVLFEGRIITVQTEAECDKAVEYLLKQDLLGFDTETRPSFRKGMSFKVALIQVSTIDTCFLFRLNMMGVPASLIRLLENQDVPIVGLSLHDDFNSISRRVKFHPGNFVELQDYIKKFGVLDMSLQKIYANLFGLKISKAQRLTNWEADVLTDHQKRYAATDAWACVKIYEELCILEKTRSYELVKCEIEQSDN